jgi:DNA-directed RNA polymerase specialized sigma24 family protein
MKRADEDDFRTFVAGRSAALLWFAHVLTGDRTDAEDVVQAALARTAAAWHRLRRTDNPEGYVRRAIVTTHLNAVRRRPWRERPAADLPEPAAPRSAEQELDELRYYEDLSEADIAEVLGCSRGTVKSQAAKAMAHLRAIFDTQGATP